MICGAVQGKWEIQLPTGSRSPQNDRATLTVSYFNNTVSFFFRRTLSQEVGPMCHYEDDIFSMERRLWDGFFSDVDELLRSLANFVPRTEGFSDRSPIGWHAISKDDLPDDKLNELLSVCFR